MLRIDKAGKVTPTPETLTIKPFKAIWDKDKTEGKPKALRVLGYIYFKYNPKSPYLKTAVGDELQEVLLNDVLKDSKWKANTDVLEAELIYSNVMITSGIKALQSAQKMLKAISSELDTGIKLGEIEDEQKRVLVMKSLLGLIEAMPEATKKLTAAVKALNDEQLSAIKNNKELSHFGLPPGQR